MKTLKPILLILLALTLTVACGQNQNEATAERSISAAVNVDRMPYNEVACAFSGAEIRTPRYGARAVNGEDVWHFRSVEDLVGWIREENRKTCCMKLEVVDFIDGKKFIDVKDAVFLYSKLRPSPGGHHLSALDKSNEHMVQRVYDAYPGPYLSWEEMLGLFEEA